MIRKIKKVLRSPKYLYKLNKKYGITVKEYYINRLYRYKFPKQKENAKEIVDNRKIIHELMNENNWTYSQTINGIQNTIDRFNISLDYYFKHKLYDLYNYEIDATLNKKSKRCIKYIEKTMEKTGWDLETTRKNIENVYIRFKISPFIYYKHKMYDMSDSEIARRIIRIHNDQKNDNTYYEIIQMLCGKDKKTIKAEIKCIKEKFPEFTINLRKYFNIGIYEYDPEKDLDEIYSKLNIFKEKIQLKKEIKEALNKIDNNEMKYADIKEEIQKYYDISKQLISNGRKEMLYQRIKYLMPELKDDDELRDKVTLDMDVTNTLLNFSPSEYVSFHFYGKTIEDKREYVSSSFRSDILNKYNKSGSNHLLNSKYESYTILKELYRRKIVLLDDNDSFAKFKKFCKTHKTFVKKENYNSLGRGVERVDITPDTNLKRLYYKLSESGKTIILEEIIKPHSCIKSLNPDSVNTVRIVTFLYKGNAEVHDCFMKVGRKGSFVDNGGAGGILVHINKETGEFDSNGIDENGIIYVLNPDYGYKFENIKLPDWDNAIKVAKKAALKIPDLRYIGWDLTYTNKNKWIIVEGNSLTQFYGQQAPIQKGIKKEFLESVRYNEQEQKN